jgi:glycosyltransferase involved in cell wall biosynthesis
MSGQTHSVSVIIPAFNAARWIAGAVESCLRQTLAAPEVIVVDDGSTDGTVGELVSFGDRVSCFRTGNGGVSQARNLGAEKSRGEWLIFLDSDDRLLPHAIESLIGAAESGSAPVAYGMVIERREPPAIAKLNGFAFCAGDPPDPSRRADLSREPSLWKTGTSGCGVA